MVEDLESLRRGGRIPGSVAYAGSKLDVKPLLTIATDGKLSLSGVARGRKKGIKMCIRDRAVSAWWCPTCASPSRPPRCSKLSLIHI